jgi:hypothetical protein
MVEVKPMKQSSEETETFFIDSDVEEEVERKQLVSETTKKEDESKTTKGRKNAKSVV